MYAPRLHPYDELLIKQRLNPVPRSRVHPIVTGPVRRRATVSDILATLLPNPLSLFRRRDDGLCCPAPSA